MIRRTLFFWVLALALAPTAVAQSASHTDTNVDYAALVKELGQSTREPGYAGFLMWMPAEFWQKAMERAGISAEKAQEKMAPLRKYTMIVAGVGKLGIGNINWISEPEVRSNLKLRDAAGNDYESIQEVSGDAKGLASVFKPMLANMLGTMGQNMEIYFFPGTDKMARPIADPLAPGSFSLVITNILGPKESVYDWKLQLTSLSPPRYCPVGKERMEANWKYCPWHGVKLDEPVSVPASTTPPSPPAPPLLGTFQNHSYSNEYFSLYYPLSGDWVRETEATRKKLSSEGQPSGTYVLLAAVHIPQTAPRSKDFSSFVVLALDRSAVATTNCQQYLQSVAANLNSSKEGQQKGEVSQFTVAGHDFYRGNFEYSHDTRYRSLLCTVSKDYLLQWNVSGQSNSAVDEAISTLRSLAASPPSSLTEQPHSGPPDLPTQIRIPQVVSQGLKIKDAKPIYPKEARQAHIQGTVTMNAVVSKEGDIVDLEVIDGPSELVVSAVNAVRQWKFRPYKLNGVPVAVKTTIMVNYQLVGG